MPESKRYYNDPAYPTTVSRDVPPGEYAWDTIVYQSGRPVLDAELNLTQGAAEYAKLLLASKTLPSGFLRGQSNLDSFQEFTFLSAIPGNENVFGLAKQMAFVAGIPVVVEYTETTNPNENYIILPPPPPSSGIAPDVKRTDFVFLEVWRTLVAPSPRSQGSISITDPQSISDGDTVTIDATAIGGPSVTFTARNAPALDTEFQIGAGASNTASALTARINDPVNGLYPSYVAANSGGSSVVTATAVDGGLDGNNILLSRVEATPGSIVLSGANFTGGADRPNKPSQSTVYRHGNVLSLPGVALPDELVDPVILSESAQRVQVQYRIRVVSDVNPKTQPDGFSNASVLAQATQGAPVAGYPFVPADNSSSSGNSDAAVYGLVDNGLWIAGDGSESSAFDLGTVDGFVYAVPIAFVFRRNDASLTGGFSPANNANGGIPVDHAGFNNANLNPAGPYAIAAGASDRPDGLFADIVVETDVLDLRRHVTPPGYDFGSELRYQLQSLLDKKTATWQVDGSDWTTIGNGSGDQSTFPLLCDEIGRETANGGVPPASGDTQRGNTIRNYDHIARRFASQSVVERVVFEVLPDAPSYPAGIIVTKVGGTSTWCEGDEITIDFNALNPTTLQDWTTPAVGGATVSSFWPVGTKVTDVVSVYHDDGHDVTPIDQRVQLATVVGVGTEEVTLRLDANPSIVNDGGTEPDHPVVDDPLNDDGSTRRIFLELEITYPTGFGLTQTPDLEVAPSPASGYPGYDAGAIIENAPAQRPPEMDAAWVPNPKFRPGFREVVLEQKSAPGATLVTDFLVTRNATTVYTPRRFFEDGLEANGAGPAAGTTFGSSERRIELAAAVAEQSLVQVDYYPQDPIPNAGGSGYQTAVYYRTQAPQTAGTQAGALPVALLPTELTVEPVAVSTEVWTGQSGKGSTSLGYPYESPLDQIAIATGDPPDSLPKEWYFSALADVSIADFSAEVGLLSLHSFVQVDGTNPIRLGDTGLARGPRKDPEFRAYYDIANPTGYKPTAMAQPLSGAARHKNFQSMLVRVTQDTRLFRKGELLLLVLSRFAELDANNTIQFSDNPAIRTAAAIYRTRNLLLSTGN